MVTKYYKQNYYNEELWDAVLLLKILLVFLIGGNNWELKFCLINLQSHTVRE